MKRISVLKTPAKLLAVIVLVMVLYIPKASADTGLQNANLLPQCADTTLATWNWANKIRTTNSGWSDFNESTDSYVVTHIANPFGDGDVTHHNRFSIARAAPGHKLTLTQISGTAKIIGDNNYVETLGIISEPNDVFEYKNNWPGSAYALNAKSISGGNFFTGTTGITLSIYAGDVNDAVGKDCESFAKNVNYGTAWGYNTFNSNILLGQDVGSSCSLTDIACIITKAYTGIQNTLVGVFTAFTNVFTTLFIPDAGLIKTQFDQFNTFMTNKLGFISYPFTFFINFFNSFTTSGGFCNDTSCIVSAGNFMGSPYQVNLTQAKTSLPGLWNLLTTIARALLVLGLVYSIRREFHSTMRK